jgi:hypothetical protein
MGRGKLAAKAEIGASEIFAAGSYSNLMDFTRQMGGSMGGYFAPTSIGPGIMGLISQGIQAVGPLLTRVGPVASKVGTAVSKILTPTVVGGTAIGVSGSIAEQVMNRMMQGGGSYGGFRKRRRMNMLNPRALRRSIRRVQGFSKFARKSFIFEKRVKMKKRRR